MKERSPEDWPIIRRDGRTYSFLDCSCDGTCKGRDCLYCSFETENGGCPGATEE